MIPANGEQVERVIGTRCDVCQTFAPASFASECNRPECAYRTPTEDARSRVKVLEEAFAEMRRYMYDRTPERRELVVQRYRDNLMRIVDAGIRTALGNKETDRHG